EGKIAGPGQAGTRDNIGKAAVFAASSVIFGYTRPSLWIKVNVARRACTKTKLLKTVKRVVARG
ncbi:MAG: hypothetical protein J0I90_00855, partial [Nitrosospira sp.]|nr:hypothetical protein [Nitrosospira sp.]